jgi:CDP-glycerol glycerophosphotransferase
LVDGITLSHQENFAAFAAALARACSERGIQLVVKPHPADGDSFALPGTMLLPQRALDAMKLPLYRLLARCDCLITDFSSVWTDFLLLDRPMMFYCPDWPEYAATRGFNVPELPSLLPGIVVDESSVEAAVSAVLEGDRDGVNLRQQIRASIGLWSGESSVDELFEALPRR